LAKDFVFDNASMFTDGIIWLFYIIMRSVLCFIWSEKPVSGKLFMIGVEVQHEPGLKFMF